MLLVGLLSLLGCAEPIPLNTTANQSGNHVERNAGDPTPRDDAQTIPRNDSGCRVTQFWAPSLQQGKTVMISGVLNNSEEVTAPYLIDVHSLEKNATVFGVECTTQKEFSIEMPEKLGEVWLAAFSDSNGDGPSKEDPQGRSQNIRIVSDDISNLDIQIQRDAPMEEAFQLAPPNGAPAGPPAENPVPVEPSSPEEGKPSSDAPSTEKAE